MSHKDYESVYIRKEKSFEKWKVEKLGGNNVPNIVIQDFHQIAKIRSIDDFKDTVTNFKPIVEQYTGRKSLWSGNIRIDNLRNPYKDWNCDIVLWPNAVDHMVLHELVHSCSTSHFGEAIFFRNFNLASFIFLFPQVYLTTVCIQINLLKNQILTKLFLLKNSTYPVRGA